ncbi:hypothetical protein Erwinia_phage_Orgeat_00061 [Erwinia phage Orgeat]|nr:hypothetical protein Erwinia_phage_Orgeat_00061 [Erwinia phage Orgeat]
MAYKVINGELVNISKYRSRYDSITSNKAERAISQEWSKDYRESSRRVRKSK